MRSLSVVVIVLAFVSLNALVYAQSTPKDNTAQSSATVKADTSSEAQPAQAKTQDLTDVSLESLTGLNVVVTSSSKKAESLMDATSAIFVITQDDIKRSGARSIPDLLTMVPGVQVARQSNNEWAISARGFNDNFNNKMLVLLDGRSVYQPITGGVSWNELDIPLEEIDRIEVIRGPGGTLWGSNAINGVINIITKDSKTTQGLYLSTSAGMPVYSDSSALKAATGLPVDNIQIARYGGLLGDSLYYKVNAQVSNSQPFQNMQSSQNSGGGVWNDGWNDLRAGLRTDYHGDDGNDLSIQAGAQKGYFGYERLTTPNVPIFDPVNFAYINDVNTTLDQNVYLQGQWSKNFKDDSQIQVLANYSYDNQSQANPIAGYQSPVITNLGQFDAEFQHRFHLNDWNEVTWGGSFRNYSDQFLNPVYWYYNPANQSLNIYGGFVQDRLTLLPDLLYVTGGLKAENNPYTGWEWQPSGHLLFTPDSKNSIWVAVSQAVRIPSQTLETSNIYVSGLPPGYGGMPTTVADFVALIPNPSLKSEILTAYELGYRTNLTKEISLDLAGFYNHYSQLVTFPNVFGSFPSPAGGTIWDVFGSVPEYQAQNTGTGDIWGGELSANWDPIQTLNLALAYTYQGYDQAMINSSNTELGAPPPHNMVSGRVSWEALPGWRLNGDCYWVDATFEIDPNINPSIPTLAPYARLDLGTTMKLDNQLSLGLWAMDLEGTHTETIQTLGVVSAQVVPRMFGQLTVQY
jgi:iron complex outermembrane receptor protein